MLTNTPRTRAKLRALARGLPNSSQHLLGFAKEFKVNIPTCEPGFADLYPLMQLFPSESKARERRRQSRVETPLNQFQFPWFTGSKRMQLTLKLLISKSFPQAVAWTKIQQCKHRKDESWIMRFESFQTLFWHDT